MVRAAAAFLIQLPETFKVQALNQSVNHPNWIMLCNILVNSLRKKHCLVGIIRTKMYLCHSENLMSKDTKSLGNNKAPACESRGFVLKKKKVRILTHLLAESRGGRQIHNADNNRLTHSPTTSPYGDSSFLKEENVEYYRLTNYYFLN